MKRSAYKLARRAAQASHRVWFIAVLGTLSALLVPLLVLDLGLIVQLLVSRGSQEVPSDWLMGQIVSGRFGHWPFLGTHENCLLALVAMGWLIAVLHTAMLILLRRAAHRHALDISSDLRHKIYTQAFRLGPYDLLGVTRTRPEELFFDQVEIIRRGFANWWMTIPAAGVALVGLIALATAVNAWLTLLAILLTVFVLRFYRATRRQEAARTEHWREQVFELEAVLRESLHQAPLLKGYSLIEPPMTTFEKSLASHASAEMELVRGETLLKPLLAVVMMVAAGFLLLIIGFAPHVSVSGTVILCVAWLAGYLPSVRLARLPAMLTEMNLAADKIHFFLDRDPNVVQLPDAEPLERISKQLLLDHVHLADRHGRHLLTELTLSIPAGQRAAIVASDPQTPLALAGLLVRCYDPTAGRLFYDDCDVGRATLDTIRSQAALVLKDGLLFPGTIAQNITCGDSNFSSTQANDALKRAAASEFVHNLPQGLSTPIGDRQSMLRPDQAFRIGLARALLRNPSLLIVQEPEGDGDETISRELDESLHNAAHACTLIVLPARISTLRSADAVYVFHQGLLHGHGKHTELLQSSELYRHLCYVRFNPYRQSVEGSGP